MTKKLFGVPKVRLRELAQAGYVLFLWTWFLWVWIALLGWLLWRTHV